MRAAIHDAALDDPPLGVALHHLGNAAEIMTTALIASLFFRDNHESARAMLQQHGYIPQMVTQDGQPVEGFLTHRGYFYGK